MYLFNLKFKVVTKMVNFNINKLIFENTNLQCIIKDGKLRYKVNHIYVIEILN